MAFNSLRHCFASCFKTRICSFLERISCFFFLFFCFERCQGRISANHFWRRNVGCLFSSRGTWFRKHLPHHFVVRVHHTLHEFFWVSVCFLPVFRHLSHHCLGVTHHFLHHHAWVHGTIFILAVSRHLLHHFLHEHSRVGRPVFLHTAHLLHVSFHHLAGSWLSFCLALFCVLLHHFAGHRFAVFFALFRPLFPHLLHFLARHFISFVVATSHHFLPEVAST